MAKEKKKRKKKPPPKKKKHKAPVRRQEPKLNQFGTNSCVAVAEITIADPDEIPEDLYIRRFAEVYYTTHNQGVTIEQMAQDERFKSVSRQALYNWSTRDGWVEKRKRYFDGLTDKLKATMTKAQVQSTIKQIKYMEKETGKIQKRLDSGDVEPKSYEGMAAIMLKMVAYVEELKTKVAGDLIPTNLGATGESIPGITPELTTEEARAAAMAVIQQRREQGVQKAEEGTGEAEAPEGEEDSAGD